METLIRGLQNGLEGKTAAARTTFKYLEYLRDASQLESYLTILIPYCRVCPWLRVAHPLVPVHTHLS